MKTYPQSCKDSTSPQPTSILFVVFAALKARDVLVLIRVGDSTGEMLSTPRVVQVHYGSSQIWSEEDMPWSCIATEKQQIGRPTRRYIGVWNCLAKHVDY